MAVSGYAALAAGGGAITAAQLPVPCGGGNCGATGAKTFVTSGTATASQTGNTLTVQQNSTKTILNWSQFNVSADGKVIFQQPTATSVALNRIFDTNPSTILGSVNSNGQIYLINPNGFVFGATAQVNTAGLIAASLGIADAAFNAGLLSPQLVFNGQPALSADLSVLGVNGNPTLDSSGNFVPGTVSIAQGAQINATLGGRLLFAAPTLVENAGTLQAPDGQIVLAAGQKVFLQASNDTALRGLVVEVDQGGKSWNQLTGGLSAPRGNITMVGLAVNQDGRISATTSVSANGSVLLEAGDNVASFPQSGSNSVIQSSAGGTLQIGPQSSISILPELTDSATAVAAQTQQLSTVKLLGEQIFVDGGSIVAPGGQLTVVAAANPGAGVAGVQSNGNGNARIRVNAGTSIDLSGSTAELPMSANLVTLQLRSNELADDPTQRNGALRGSTVTLDARVGTPIASAASVQAAVAAIPENIAQRTETGGSAQFIAEGDVVVAQGASIDVSGGKTLYDAGQIQTTQLIGANGKLYDIGTANPLTGYVGVLNPTFTQSYNKWGVQTVVPTPGLSHYESGYTQGAAAGSIAIAAPSMVLNGQLTGHAVNGPFQRTGAAAVSGGQLIIGVPGGLPSNSLGTDYLSPAVVLVNQATPIAVNDSAALPSGSLLLPTDYLVNGGFTSTAIYDNTHITVPAGVPLDLIPGSSLTLWAPRIDVLAGITDLAGSVRLRSVQTVTSQATNLGRPGIELGDGVALDVSGQWTNDALLPGTSAALQTTLLNAGSILMELTAPGGELVLGNAVALHASGGAWVNSVGKVANGRGGAITMLAGPSGSALQVGGAAALDAFGVGSAAGGALTLAAPRLSITDGSNWTLAQRADDTTAPDSNFKLYSALFSEYGFSTISLMASGVQTAVASPADALSIASGTQIDALTRNWQLGSDYLSRAGGGSVRSFASVVTLPQALRAVENLAFTVMPAATSGFSATLGVNDVGLLDVMAGSRITTDPGATVKLAGVGGVTLAGAVAAPAGTITVETLTPPNEQLDPGYVPGLELQLANTALLDVSGVLRGTPNDLGLSLGSMLPGGTVNLYADRGSVLAQAGSAIDFSGTSAALDVAGAAAANHYLHETVASAAGALTVRSPESVALLGTLRGGAGTGGAAQPAGGSLDIDLTRSRSWFSVPSAAIQNTFPATPRQISLVAASTGSSPAEGQSIISAQGLAGTGIDSLRFEAGDGLPTDLSSVSFGASLSLTLGRQLVLDAPSLVLAPGVAVALQAPYVAIGNSLSSGTSGAVPATPGNGTLNVSAQTIDLIGATTVAGTGALTLSSAGDILLRGAGAGGDMFSGGVLTAGNLTLDASRVYPATATNFALTSLGTGNTIAIGQSKPSPGTPLSAGGSLTVTADQISSSGTLIAPFGAIDLEAGSALTLSNGSLTSVSAGSLVVPYGSTQLQGAQWVYLGAPLKALPNREVTLHGAVVTLASGATVDLRGGGDLYAYEWVPGTGGSADRLANNAAPGLYAVLPSMVGQSAPYDPSAYAGSTLTGDARVYLSGVSGLPAGLYPLLPPRYALLPGARLVQVQAGYQNLVPGQRASLADGTPVIAGYLVSGASGLSTGLYSGFAVWPTGYARSLAGYSDTYASTFFPASTPSGSAAVPADAGRLSVDVLTALNAAGQVLSAAAPGGRAAQVDVSATQLEVSASAVPSSAGVVDLPAATLQQWGAGELVLGGRASVDNRTLAVSADSVTIGSGVQLLADQIVLLANQSIDLQSGATLSSTSAKTSAPLAALPAPSTVTLSGAGATGAAVLAISDQSLILAQRPTAPSGSSNTGTVTLESGAVLATRGALAVDAPGGANLVGGLSLAGASVSLAAPSIGVLPQGVTSDAVQINAPLLSALQLAGAVRLASQGAISFYAPTALGVAGPGSDLALSNLTLVASTLNNIGGSDITLGAKTVVLQGIDGGNPGAPTAGTGTFNVVASELDVGPGALSINGFGQANFAAGAAIVGQGAGALLVGGNTTLSAAVLTAAPGSQTLISSPTGAMTIASSPPSGGTTLPTFLGGALSLSANSIQTSGAISVPSGLVSLQATQDLTIAASASINAGGTLVTVLDQSVGSAGGAIRLGAGGNLSTAGGSLLGVAGAGQAPAGGLLVSGGGSVTLQSTLLGSAGTGATGGNFALQAGTLGTSLDALAMTLLSGGFTDRIGIQVAAGDLQLGAGGQLTSNRVTLSADTGSVSINGAISAPSASQRGQIGLYGSTGVVLGATGQLHADGTGSAGRGGAIELGTGPTGSVSLAAGSVVSTLGPAQPGALLIRAPVLNGSDVAVTNLNADFSGVGQVVIEPVSSFVAGTTLGVNDYAAAQLAVNTYMATAGPVISSRLNPAGTLPLVVQPGVEFNAGADLTITDPLDLSTWRYGAQPVDFTVRAAGSLQVLGALSDGFVAATTATNQPTVELGSGPSASIRLVAGANLASADPLAATSAAADLTLAPGIIVRSGTGEVDLIAARDVLFGSNASVYTAGLPAAAALLVPKSNSVANFATGGGNLQIVAGRDIQGAAVTQSISAWQVREGNASSKPVAVQWGTDVSQFGWNAGALGGGDLSVRAGGSVVNLSAAAAGSLIANADGSATNLSGGGLLVGAGGDVGSGQFYAADGVARLSAGGGFTAVRTIPQSSSASNVGSLLALNDAQLELQARLDVNIDAVVNPTTLTQPGNITTRSPLFSGYFTYGEQSALTIQSTAGSIAMGDDGSHLGELMGQAVASGFGGQSGEAYPGTFIARSLQQNVTFSGAGATLFPSDRGQLELLAGHDIVGTGASIVVSDAFANSLPTPAAPGSGGAITSSLLAPFASTRHVGDAVPGLVTAGRDIDGLTLSIPKQAQITAGRDITNLDYHGQNLAASNLTLLSAGRDVIDTLDDTSAVVEIGGPGRVDVLGGRNVDLGASEGITTVGNQRNPNLATGAGSDLSVVAGVGQGANFSQFLTSIIEPSTLYQQQLLQFVQASTGQASLTVAQADAAFVALGPDQQRPFIDQVFFDALRSSGREANTVPGAGFVRGYAAIDALFPMSRSATLTPGSVSPYQGNIDLTFSRTYTVSGGTISLLAPGGAVNVGLANPPAGISTRDPSQLGIVAQGKGDVDIYSKSDVLVNQSRIFTLGGGNILIWSDEGNIDAGRGSKSSISAPPPQVLIDAAGNVTLDLSGAVAGSGIRTIQIDPNTSAGNVDLIAPQGTVNAGDAGIGAAGNINIAAQQVVGLDNIQFGGAASGVPSQVSNLGASLAGATAASSSTANAANSSGSEESTRQSQTPLAQSALSWLEVFVTGLGEENCRPDDLDCLRRQKTATN